MVQMTYVQATSGHGGWPMSVFLTPGATLAHERIMLRLPGDIFLSVSAQLATGSPATNMRCIVHADLQPFMGGTYFPPKDAFGRPGFTTVLQRISEVWRSKQAMVEEQTADVMRQLQEHTKPQRACVRLLEAAQGCLAAALLLVLATCCSRSTASKTCSTSLLQCST